MYSLFDMTTERAQTAIVLCPSCVLTEREEATPTAMLDIEHPTHCHMWANCDDEVDTDRCCDCCGNTAAQANKAFRAKVAARLDRKRNDKAFEQREQHLTHSYGLPDTGYPHRA